MPTTAASTGNWGRWGDDDERGALNLLTPDVVKAATASIRTGRVYGLGAPVLGQSVPVLPHRGAPMRLTLTDSTDAHTYDAMGAVGTGAHEDVLILAAHSGSHMDALVHVYRDRQHYNGVGYDTMRALTGAQKLGIEKAGGFAARAVLLDMVAYFGEETHVEIGRTFAAADLQGAAAAEGVDVRAGDVVLIRTGFLECWRDRAAAGTGMPPGNAGIGGDAAEWLAEMDVVAVASDNIAVEVIPFEDGDVMRVHKLLLVDRGIYFFEFLDLLAPAADRAYEGLFVVGPLKVTGATGSPVNPIFIS